MEKGKVYPLYNFTDQFIEEARKQGFRCGRIRYLGGYAIKLGNTIRIRTEDIDIGEIVDNRFLIVFTSIRNKQNGKFNMPVSKLQKLARDFVIS